MIRPDDPDQQTTPAAAFPAGPSRREFLQASAAMAGATLLSSCIMDSSSEGMPESGAPPDYFANIRNLVVVMFENRSFDNLLGYLYSQGPTPVNWPNDRPVPPAVPAQGGGTIPKFEGLWQFPGTASPTCAGDAGCNSSAGNQVAAHPNPIGVTTQPSPDPYEPWEHVKMQVFDIATDTLLGNETPKMSGFLRSYTDKLGSPTTTPNPADAIMASYTPDQVPVISTLAQNFAVFDHWFCAVPSQTYCNRAFFHASTSYGIVVNGSQTESNADKWKNAPGKAGIAPFTIFDVLETQSVTNKTGGGQAPWGVYFSGGINEELVDDSNSPAGAPAIDYTGLTGLIHYEVGRKYGPPETPDKDPTKPQRIWPFEKFFDDAAKGALPQYTFVEPLGGHLPFPLPVCVSGNDYHPPQDVRNGEEALRKIYEAIRTSPMRDSTMLLIVFDEHGGTYDHVKVPATIAPDTSPLEAPDCKFNWLGVRIPAIAISSYTLPGTIVTDEMHHAAVIKTLLRMNPGPVDHLSERDRPATVNDLGKACNGPRPAAAAWPILPPPQFPPCPK